VILALKTGMKKSEILNLTWDRVDRKEGIVRLEPGETKNAEGRTLYPSPASQQAFGLPLRLPQKGGENW